MMRKRKAVKVLNQFLEELSRAAHDGQIPPGAEADTLDMVGAVATAIRTMEQVMEAQNAYSKKWRERNPERRKEIEARYREKHKEELRAKHRERYQKEKAKQFKLMMGGKDNE